MNESGDAQATGAEGLSESDAAERIASLLTGDGDSDGGETQPGDDPDEAPEGDEPEDAVDPEDEDETDEAEQPATFTVKVDGEEVAVTLDELQKGYSRTQDYTRKTMEIAEVRKAAEAEVQALRDEREQYGQILPQLRAYLESQLAPSEDLQQLRFTDPAEYAARMEDNRQLRERIAAVEQEQRGLSEKASRDADAQRQAAVQRELGELVKALPEWNDPKVRQETMNYAVSAGFAPDEIADTVDHRAFVILHKARLYDQLKAKAPETKAKVDAVKTAKPGGGASQPSKTTELTRSKQRLAKTGRVDDAAAAIERLLGA